MKMQNSLGLLIQTDVVYRAGILPGIYINYVTIYTLSSTSIEQHDLETNKNEHNHNHDT